jgi:hypothetical protein
MAAMTMTSYEVSGMSIFCGRALLTDVLAIVEHLLDLLADLTIGDLDIVFGVAGIVHQGKEVIIGDIQLLVR